MATRIGEERIGDERYEIEVDSDGTFRAVLEPGGEAIAAKTLEELKAQLKAAVKKAQAFKPIEVTLYDIQPIDKKNGRHYYGSFPWEQGLGLLDCTLRGWSDRRRALLLTIEGKKYINDDWHMKENVARRFTQDEALMYEHLVADLKQAEEALASFLAPRRINVRELVEAAKGGA